MAKLDMTAAAACSLNHTHGAELLAVAGERADACRLCGKCRWVFLPLETLVHWSLSVSMPLTPLTQYFAAACQWNWQHIICWNNCQSSVGTSPSCQRM